MSDRPPPDPYEALLARLDALTAALAPAVTPATRPTWDQLQWAPGPTAFGPGQAAAPSPTAVDPDGSPSHVVTNELIESAWGNAVVDEIDRVRAAARAREADAQSYQSTSILSVPAAAWTQFNVGQIVTAYPRRVMVIAQATVGATGGDAYIAAGYNNALISTPSPPSVNFGAAFQVQMTHVIVVDLAAAGTWPTHIYANVSGGGGSIRNMTVTVVQLKTS